ncbi:hypothetical protein EYF80_025196 [Liparis tanakae]|uniref:Uncharacterized protein n=1 Tax=Liparis tanakae TaxID=230148 RepID=A0A4Z2HFE5_9TELE|nr:hypothetical protein EYF80_025196 [Liparis tanakae]
MEDTSWVCSLYQCGSSSRRAVSSSMRICEGLRKKKKRTQSHSELTFRPSRAPESRGTLPSFMRLLSKIRPMRRSPSLDGCHVTGCYKVRATHLLFNNAPAPMGLLQCKADKCLQ